MLLWITYVAFPQGIVWACLGRQYQQAYKVSTLDELYVPGKDDGPDPRTILLLP